MRISRIGRRISLPTLALVSLSLALPLVSQAAKAPSTALGPPSAATGNVGHVQGASVPLTGEVGTGNEATSYYFRYGPTATYGAVSATSVLPASPAKVKVSVTVTGMAIGWHYRLVAVNKSGTKEGHDRTYTAKSTKLKVTLNRPAIGQNIVGKPVTLTGTLAGTGAGNHSVILQANPYPYRGAFTTVGAAQLTNGAGGFTFHVPNLLLSTEYRVATVDSRPALSSVVTELAAVRVTLHVRTSAHRGLVRLYGTVSPAITGAHVYFQLEQPASEPRRPPKSEKAEEKAELPKFASKFVAPVKRTGSTSHFSSIVTIQISGRYRAFVVPPKGPLAAGYSMTTVSLHAAKSKKKKKSKGIKA